MSQSHVSVQYAKHVSVLTCTDYHQMQSKAKIVANVISFAVSGLILDKKNVCKNDVSQSLKIVKKSLHFIL